MSSSRSMTPEPYPVSPEPEAGPPRPKVFHEQLIVPPLLERRLWAAAIDMAVVLACCSVLAYSFSPLVKSPDPWVWRPAAVVLSLYAMVELLTGVTLGKLLARLRVRRAAGGGGGGGPAPLWMLAARAALKYVPVLVLLPSFFADGEAFVIIGAVAFTLAVAEVQACYLAMVRTGVTIFDHIVGTVVIRSDGPS